MRNYFFAKKVFYYSNLKIFVKKQSKALRLAIKQTMLTRFSKKQKYFGTI